MKTQQVQGGNQSDGRKQRSSVASTQQWEEHRPVSRPRRPSPSASRADRQLAVAARKVCWPAGLAPQLPDAARSALPFPLLLRSTHTRADRPAAYRLPTPSTMLSRGLQTTSRSATVAGRRHLAVAAPRAVVNGDHGEAATAPTRYMPETALGRYYVEQKCVGSIEVDVDTTSELTERMKLQE